MSLFARLNGMLFGVILMCFLTNLITNIQESQNYLEEQLNSHSQDAATSLGLSLSNIIGLDDIAMVETTVNSIFDSGYYRSIKLFRIDGTPLVEREYPTQIEGIPNWFISLFPLNPPVNQTEINDGWRIVATMKIQSNPGLAYYQLWQMANNTFISSGIIFVLALFTGWLLLRLILRPLSAIEAKANAIADKDFSPIAMQPKARELRIVVEAFNRMAAALKRNFDEISSYAENMRQQAFMDTLTGFGNKRSFMSKLSLELESKKSNNSGLVGLFQLQGLQELNEELGYQEADRHLKNLSMKLKQNFSGQPQSSFFRLQGPEFAVIMPNTDLEVLEQIAPLLNQTLNQANNPVAGAFVRYQEGLQSGAVLAQLDNQISHSISQGCKISIANQDNVATQRSDWHGIINDIIAYDRIKLVFQPIINVQKQTLYYETLTRFVDSKGEPLNTGDVFSAANRINQTKALDQAIFKQVMATLVESSQVSLSINLAGSSLAEADFQTFVLDAIKQAPQLAKRLIIEVSETSANHFLVDLKALVGELKQAGSLLSIDRFGTSFTSFSYIQSLKPDYLKIDGSYIRQLEQHKDNQFFLKTLVQIAHGIDTKVIAEHIETQQELDTAKELLVDGFQGYLVAKPGAIKN
ncbi:bifunctional diguanylate cyclase/phosphodiesterase [Motilimonas eburnea]|uniref:bifunctional diguanylate cyclase/phosphodiesterase n=1 Tax=Motilimonas eburnea TaxID=1737488 RepID=UPI001E513BF1|nr:EAL domain-containing protein [Motilimonas eburnea]MCE2570637.1 EAL domain-containing protein [Motilimonas eburnea]